MALSATEVRKLGLVSDGDVLAVTTATAGATWQQGLLRDADGRLVVQHG